MPEHRARAGARLRCWRLLSFSPVLIRSLSRPLSNFKIMRAVLCVALCLMFAGLACAQPGGNLSFVSTTTVETAFGPVLGGEWAPGRMSE